MSGFLSRGLSRLLCILVSALALGACESTTAPDDHTQRIAVGTVVSGSLAAGDSGRAYLFPATADSRYVVFAAVLEGTLLLSVRDSAHQSAMATAVASPSGRPLQESTALQFTASASGTYVLGVSGYPAHTAVRFQILIYVVHDSPENGPAAFAIGDTVGGETLDPIADIDVFTAHLQAGQDFVVVAEAPAATGVGPLALAVWDSTETLAFTFFPTACPPRSRRAESMRPSLTPTGSGSRPPVRASEDHGGFTGRTGSGRTRSSRRRSAAPRRFRSRP